LKKGRPATIEGERLSKDSEKGVKESSKVHPKAVTGEESRKKEEGKGHAKEPQLCENWGGFAGASQGMTCNWREIIKK